MFWIVVDVIPGKRFRLMSFSGISKIIDCILEKKPSDRIFQVLLSTSGDPNRQEIPGKDPIEKVKNLCMELQQIINVT